MSNALVIDSISKRYADFNMLGDDGEPAAGVCHARGVNVGLPPVWMIYLPVGDLAEVSAAYRRRGARSSGRCRGRVENTFMRPFRIRSGPPWR